MPDIVPTPPASSAPPAPHVQAQAPSTPTLAPGWYPDPSAPGTQRWWTGREWSNHTTAVPTVVVVPKRTNHAFHLLMSVFTFGLWIPVWIIVALTNA